MFHVMAPLISSTDPIVQALSIASLFICILGITASSISIYIDLKVVRLKQSQEKLESWYKRPQTTMSISLILIFMSLVLAELLPTTSLYAVLRVILILSGLVFLAYSFRLIYNARRKRS